MRPSPLPAVAAIAIALAPIASSQPSRYVELRRVIDRNTGFAHGTRGVNMYTLYALRACVTAQDLPVLDRLLSDKDRVTRMATADVLADLGAPGREVVRKKLSTLRDAAERLMLQEAVDNVQKPGYRPILEYPLTDRERSGIRGCK